MGTFRYGLRDLKIASWVAENSYGTEVDVDAAQSFTVTLVTKTDALEGDDVEKDSYAKITSIEANMRNGDVSLDVLELLTGGTLYEGVGYTDMKIGETDNVPYFSVCGKVVGTASGCTMLWICKAKINGNISYQAQQNSYLIPEVAIKGVNEGDINGMVRIRHYDADVTVAIPLPAAS
jgi:hypothetical protein